MLQTLKEASLRRGSPAEFRREVLDPVEAGRPVRQVAHDLGVSEQTIHVWCRQHLIDTGQLPGPAGEDQAGPAAARRRIAILLSPTRGASVPARPVGSPVCVTRTMGARSAACGHANRRVAEREARHARAEQRQASPGPPGPRLPRRRTVAAGRVEPRSGSAQREHGLRGRSVANFSQLTTDWFREAAKW